MGPVAADELRAERAEAAYWATYARNLATTDDTRDTGAVPVAGGYAICLQGSSLAYGLGVGTSRPLRDDDLQIVDEFYGDRGLPSQLELHPHVAERDARLLRAWGYAAVAPMAMLERDIVADPLVDERFAVEIFTSRKTEWTDLVVAGLTDATPAAELDRLHRTTFICASAASALVAVRIEGRLAGGGAVGVTGDVAFLFCAATLPAYRRRGVHAALINARLAIGRSRGATFAFLTARPGSPALGSAQSAGFRATYIRRRLRKHDGAVRPSRPSRESGSGRP